MIYNLVIAVKRNTKTVNRGVVTINNDNQKLIRALTTKIEKAT